MHYHFSPLQNHFFSQQKHFACCVYAICSIQCPLHRCENIFAISKNILHAAYTPYAAYNARGTATENIALVSKNILHAAYTPYAAYNAFCITKDAFCTTAENIYSVSKTFFGSRHICFVLPQMSRMCIQKTHAVLICHGNVLRRCSIQKTEECDIIRQNVTNLK